MESTSAIAELETTSAIAELHASDVCEAKDWYSGVTPILYLLYVSVFCVALLGNLLVVYVVFATPRMRTTTNYWLVNLAVGDGLMTILCIPFSFISTFRLQYWPYGAGMCIIVNYSQAVSVLVSAYTLVAISADRYMAIARPLKPRLNSKQVCIVLGVVWVLAALTAFPIVLMSKLTQPNNTFKNCGRYLCTEEWSQRRNKYFYSRQNSYLVESEGCGWYDRGDPQISLSRVAPTTSHNRTNLPLPIPLDSPFSLLLMTLQYILPLVVLLFTYTRIVLIVWGKRTPGEAHNTRDRRRAVAKRKMIKMMVAVVLVLTICWLPLNILQLVLDNDEKANSWPALPYVYLACHWLAMSHSCANPLIYCWMNSRFRQGFRAALGRLTCARYLLPRSLMITRANTLTTFVSMRNQKSGNSLIQGRPTQVTVAPKSAPTPTTPTLSLDETANPTSRTMVAPHESPLVDEAL